MTPYGMMRKVRTKTISDKEVLMSRRNNDDMTGCLAQILLVVFLMPVVGLYFALGKNSDDESRTIGWVLFFVGIVIWIVLALL